VSDAVNAIIVALKLEKSSKINVAGPEILSIRQIGDIIGKKLGKDPVFVCGTDKEQKNLIGNISKMSQLLTPPVMRFTEGLQTILRKTE
jgi:UDP-glucose 4-epimerase